MREKIEVELHAFKFVLTARTCPARATSEGRAPRGSREENAMAVGQERKRNDGHLGRNVSNFLGRIMLTQDKRR